MQRVSLLDPNQADQSTNSYKKYTREQILSYLKDPRKNNTNLIEASNYLYASSVIYQRVVRYLANMLTFDYVVSPYKLKDIDTSVQNVDKYKKSYFNVLNTLEIMDIKQTFSVIMQVVVREGAFFGIEVGNKDSYMIQQMPYNRCKVYSNEDGCPLFSLDMSYFDRNEILLESMPSEIQTLYNAYKSNNNEKWALLDGKYSICILFDESLGYVLPPFAGSFTDIYLVEDYKDLMKSKEIINLYKLISLKYPTDAEGNLLMDSDIAMTYYHQIADQLGEQFAVALNPFDMKEVSFADNKTDSDGTLKAQRDMFANLGISNLLFSNDKAASSALLTSVLEDFSYVSPCLRSIERWVNKKLKIASGTVKFQVMFPDVTVYNREKMMDKYKEASAMGLPCKMLYSACMGLTPSQTMGMCFLENNMLGIVDMFVPLKTSYTQSSDGGRPESEEPLTESGEQTKETDANANRAEV